MQARYAAMLLASLSLAWNSVAQAQQASEADTVDEVVVTATRRPERRDQVPRAITVIPREQIEQQAALSTNLGDILGKLVPGFGQPTQSASSFGQSLRGRNFSVLIDGIPQSTSRNALRDLRTIAPIAIERIEILRGTSALYGDGATGGIINIITRRPTAGAPQLQTDLTAALALTNTADSLGGRLQQFASFKNGATDFTLSAAFERTGGFFDANGQRIPPDPNGQGGISDVNTFDLFTRFGLDITADQRLELALNYYDDRQTTAYTNDPSVNAEPGRQPARARIGLALPDPQASRNTLVSLTYNHAKLLGSAVRLQTYYRNYLTRFFPSDSRAFASLGNAIFQSRIDSEKYGTRLEVDTLLARNLNLVWGLDYARESTAQPVTIFDPAAFDASSGRVFQPIGARTWVPQLRQDNLGLFGQLRGELDRLVLSGGVRYERATVAVDDFTTLANVFVPGGRLDYDATLFNLGVVYNLTDQFNLYANFAQGFSLADIGRTLRAAPAGTSVAALRPEAQKVDSYEVGLRGRWSGIQASVAGFFNSSDLGTTFGPDLSIVRAPERIYGVEATLDVQPGPGWLSGVSFTWLEGENDLDRDGTYRPLDGFRIQPPKLSFYLEHRPEKGWSHRLQLLYSGERNRFGPSLVFGERPVSSYVLVDYIGTWQLGGGNALRVAVENLFNTAYFPVTSQLYPNDSSYAAGRGTTLSLGYSLSW